jgi:hypothetical protein
MRRLLTLWLAVWLVSACVDGNAAVPQPTPSATANADPIAVPATAADREGRPDDEVRLGPDAGTHHSPGIANPAVPRDPPAPPDPRAVAILSPSIRTIAAPFAIAALQTHAATPADLDAIRPTIGDWSKNLIGMLERRRHPQPGVDVELDLRNIISEPRAAQVVVKSLATATITGQPEITLVDWRLNGGLMRVWGSPAFLDVTVRARDHGPTEDVDLTWRMRLQPIGLWYRAIDVFDAASGTWLIGEAPRYSAVELNAELRWSAQSYLGNESYSGFRPTNSTFGGADTAFWRARTAAINELNRRFAAGELSERYFEDVSATIERFEPAWFGGDGVVTVMLRGRLVETVAGGRHVTSGFAQRLKFLRTFDFWTAVDAQEDDGSWDSGGDLALADVARPHG